MTEGEFVAACYNYPPGFDTEMMPTGKVYDHSLLVVFDAFEEICKRLSEVSHVYIAMGLVPTSKKIKTYMREVFVN